MALRIPIIALLLLATTTAPALAAAADNRDLLWRVVQACLLNHSLTGAAFPCVSVETTAGLPRGYAVVREPGDRTRLVIVPTVRTAGIEAKRLRGADAPNYFQDAWASRRFLVAGPARADIAMAVNSRPGRSQDQLHVHLACIRPDVKRSILAQRRKIRADRWTQLKVLPGLAPYTMRFVAGADLGDINPFDQAAEALHVPPDEMAGVTVVVMGADAEIAANHRAMPAGFILMARGKQNPTDWPHGEGLLDPACKAYRRASASER